MDYDGEERRARERWKFSKEISLADLISFVSAALAVVYAYTTLDKRMTLVERGQEVQESSESAKAAEALRTQARIDLRLDKMDEKLDRLIQRR